MISEDTDILFKFPLLVCECHLEVSASQCLFLCQSHLLG